MKKKTLFEYCISKLDLSPSAQYIILDFGCGAGDLLGLVSENIGAGSSLVGIDSQAALIREANNRYPKIHFFCDKFAEKLCFRDASLDIIMTVDAIECIGAREVLVSEFHRILKPGGKVLAAHWDWDTMLYGVENADVARKAIAAFSGWKQPWMDNSDGQMGRKLWGLFEESRKFRGKPDSFNLLETSYEPGKYGYDRMQEIAKLIDTGGITKEEYEKLQDELIKGNQKGRYFFSLTSFIYYGEKV